MGGLLIVFAVSVSVLLWADLTNAYVWMTMLVFIGFSAVGFIDDFMKVSHHQNKGLSPRAKFAGQMLVAGIAMLLLVSEPAYSTRLAFPFFKTLNPDLGYWYIPFAMLVMVGTSNAVNLTDGLDGLAIGRWSSPGWCFRCIFTSRGMCGSPSTCNLNTFPGWARSLFSAVRWLARGLGSSGSTPIPPRCSWATWGRSGLGGVLAFLAVLCKQELLLLIVGGLFVAETLSVILQVSYFKASGGKRIFRMAPLHHHYEMKGIPESKIIIRFWIISVMLGLIALSALKLR